MGFGVRGILGLYTSTGLAHRETLSSLCMEDRSVITVFQGSVKAVALLAESPDLEGRERDLWWERWPELGRGLASGVQWRSEHCQ